ncbi:Cuticlin-1 [Dirofilaria immitis]
MMLSWMLFTTTICRDSMANNRVIENSIIGEPVVKCGVNGIEIDVVTMHSFSGRLYVQDESDDPNCVISHYGRNQESYTLDETSNDSQTLRFSLKFGECNMRRQRMLNPRGVAYTFILIVSFHPIFETEVDRAYRIRCFFIESVKALEATLAVSQLTTQIVEQDFAFPTCVYEIRESRTGPFVKFAHIGDHVWHVWHCDLVAGMMYGMLIHSCHVDDGKGKQVPVVDNKGCVLDPLLLSDIEYDDQAITAYAETRVFKYSDKTQLYFTCTIQLCIKNDGGCDDVTPPICQDVKYLTQSSIEYSSDHNHYNDLLHFRHTESEKEFFGPISADHKERNLHLTPPQKSLLKDNFVKTSAISDKLRIPRGIPFISNLNPPKTATPEMRIAETDVTTRFVVFPLVEVQPSNASSSINKVIRKESRMISICLSSLDVLLFLGIIIFLFGFIAILIIRHIFTQSCITLFMDEKMLKKRSVDYA